MQVLSAAGGIASLLLQLMGVWRASPELWDGLQLGLGSCDPWTEQKTNRAPFSCASEPV